MARKTQPARRKPGARERVLAEIRTDIRAAGLRSIVPRIAVLERLRRARAPLSHPELTAQLVPLGFDRATIYRNLVDLADAGLVSRVEVGDHVWRYEVRGRDHASGEVEHSHFVCNDCGIVLCLSEVSIAIRPAPGSRRSVVAEISDVVLKGRCESW